MNFIDPLGLYGWYSEFNVFNPNSTMNRQSIGMWQGIKGSYYSITGDNTAANKAFRIAGTNSGQTIMKENCASPLDYGLYYGSQAVSGIMVAGALLGGIAEMAGIIDTAPQGNNIIRIISTPLKRGFRLDKPHHGQGIHKHFWKW